MTNKKENKSMVSGEILFHDKKTLPVSLALVESTRAVTKKRSTIIVDDGNGGTIALRSTIGQQGSAPLVVSVRLNEVEFSGTTFYTLSRGAADRWIKQVWMLNLTGPDESPITVAYVPGALDVEKRAAAEQALVDALAALDKIRDGEPNDEAEQAALDAVQAARVALVNASKWKSEKGRNTVKGWSTEILTGPTIEVHDENGVLRITPTLRRGFALRVAPDRWEFSFASTYKALAPTVSVNASEDESEDALM